MKTPVSILFTKYRAKYSFNLLDYRPQIDSELITDKNKLDALYSAAGIGATGLAIQGIPSQTAKRVGSYLNRSMPVAFLAALAAGTAIDKDLVASDPLRMAAGVGLASAGTGMVIRGLENSLQSIIRPGAGNFVLKTAPLVALTTGALAYARGKRDDFGKII